MISTLRCEGTVDQVLRRLAHELDVRRFQLLCVVDHSGDAVDAGFAMAETKLVMFGCPQDDTPLMLAHPLLALDLPSKLLLWENADQNAFVSYRAPETFAEMHGLAPAELAPLHAAEMIARAVKAAHEFGDG